MSAAPRERLFSRRMLLGVLLAGLPALLASLILAVAGSALFEPESWKADSYSLSAVGYRGLVDVLKAWGYPVLRSRYKSETKVGAGDLLVFAEPERTTEQFDLTRVIGGALERGAAVLVILPKWDAAPSARVPGWIAEVRPRATGEIESLLDATSVVGAAPIRRLGPQPAWRTELASSGKPELDAAQVVSPEGLGTAKAIIGADEGFLIAGKAERATYLIADPDLVNNGGLGRGGNASILAALLGDVIRPRAIVIDETSHGYVRPPALLATVLRYPLILFTAPLLLALGLVAWRCMHRFGKPEEPPPRLPPGKAGLLENMAQVLVMGGHTAHAAREYLRLSCYLAGRQLNLGPDMDSLSSASAARGVATTPAELAERLRGSRLARHDWRAALAFARSMHAWRVELCDAAAAPRAVAVPLAALAKAHRAPAVPRAPAKAKGEA